MKLETEIKTLYTILSQKEKIIEVKVAYIKTLERQLDKLTLKYQELLKTK